MARRQDHSQIGDEDLSLGALLGMTKPREKVEKPQPSVTAAAPSANPLNQPLRLRLERKGHGGKDVTVLQGFGDSAEAVALVKALKGALGCGGRFTDGTASFQGDQRTRLLEELSRRGAKDVK